MARNILACYNELFAENAVLFSQNIQINHVLADFVPIQHQPLARYGFPTRRRTRIISRCSTITCTLVGTIAIVHKSQLFTNVTIATNTNIRSAIDICDLWTMLVMKICEQYSMECPSYFWVITKLWFLPHFAGKSCIGRFFSREAISPPRQQAEMIY